MALSQQPVTQENMSWAERFAPWMVAGGNGSMLEGRRIYDLKIVSLWEKMCWEVLPIAESGWGQGENRAGAAPRGRRNQSEIRGRSGFVSLCCRPAP